jgi:hypothetical protein
MMNKKDADRLTRWHEKRAERKARREGKAASGPTENKAVIPVVEDKWTLAISPEVYLERYPEGPNADLARSVIGG